VIIEVNVFSSLRHYLPDSENRLDGNKWEVREGSRVDQILKMLNIPDEEAHIVLVNGRKAGKETVLKQGDLLHVFPLMAGG